MPISLALLSGGRTRVNLVDDAGPDDEQCKHPAAQEDRDERPEDPAPHACDDDHPRYSQGDCGKNSEDESTGAIPFDSFTVAPRLLGRFSPSLPPRGSPQWSSGG